MFVKQVLRQSLFITQNKRNTLRDTNKLKEVKTNKEKGKEKKKKIVSKYKAIKWKKQEEERKLLSAGQHQAHQFEKSRNKLDIDFLCFSRKQLFKILEGKQACICPKKSL